MISQKSRHSMMTRLLSILVPLLLMGWLVSWESWRELHSSTDSLEHAARLNELALGSRIAVSEMGSALKGYLLNPSNTAEADRKKAADDENSRIITEMEKIADNATLKSLIGQLGELDDKKLNPAEDKVLELVKTGNIKDAQQYFVQAYLPLRESYDTLSKQLASEADKASDTEVSAVKSQMGNASIKIITLLLVGISVIAAILIWICRDVARVMDQIVGALSRGAERLGAVSREMSDNSTTLSRGTTAQSGAIHETAASTEEVSAMLTKSADNARRSQAVSAASEAAAGKGKQVVEEVIQVIDGIKCGNERMMQKVEEGNREVAGISEIISNIASKTQVINDIVFQTKLLSFNASVEAARAGEHGKGFAVVAEEVGNLAQMSGNAAKEITAMLDQSVRKVESVVNDTRTQMDSLMRESHGQIQAGLEVAKRCGGVLDEIVDRAQEVKTHVEEIASACTEQSNGVAEINKAVTQLERITQETVEVSNRNSTTANEVEGQVHSLNQVLDSLRKAVHGAKSEVRLTPQVARKIANLSPELDLDRFDPPTRIAS